MLLVTAAAPGARRIRAALVALLATVLMSPLVQASTYRADVDGRIALVTAGLGVPVMAPLLLTIAQERRRATTTFAPVPMSAAGGLVACTILVLSASLDYGAVLAFVTVPLATGFVVVSWSQLPIWWAWRIRLAFLLGVAVAPLVTVVAWQLAHRRSEPLTVAALVAAVVSITILRRSGIRETSTDPSVRR